MLALLRVLCGCVRWLRCRRAAHDPVTRRALRFARRPVARIHTKTRTISIIGTYANCARARALSYIYRCSSTRAAAVAATANDVLPGGVFATARWRCGCVLILCLFVIVIWWLHIKPQQQLQTVRDVIHLISREFANPRERGG